MDKLLQFNVNFYTECPQGVESLHKQTGAVFDRLRLYGALKSHEKITAETLKSELHNNTLRHLLEPECGPEINNARYEDYLSHWTLKIAYSDAHPTFFMKNELKWFKLRFNNMTHIQRTAFVETFSPTEATEDEKSKFNLTSRKWYKLHFTEVPELVKLRLYPTHKGCIFVPDHKMEYWLEQKFKTGLSSSLHHCKKMLPSACDELRTLLHTFELVKPNQYEILDKFTLEDLDASVKHFPLCMKFQYENLRANHHLRHFSRVQFGLFLKGLGMSLEDALAMWREEFTRVMTEKWFQKEYSYFFKHQYGTVGSKINYRAQSCDKILEEGVGRGDTNGCPFKHWDQEVLTRRLDEDGVPPAVVSRIKSLKKSSLYRSACTVYFRSLHKQVDGEVISHPIEYFQRSCSSGDVVDIEDLVSEESF